MEFNKGKSTYKRLYKCFQNNAYNINDLKWDQKVLEALEIPPSILPKVVNSSGVCAYTDQNYRGVKVPIGGMQETSRPRYLDSYVLNQGWQKHLWDRLFLLMNIGEKPINSKMVY